jgi:hypothetical protein
VRLIEGVGAAGQRGEGRCRCEKEVTTQAVVCVDCVAGLERDFFFWSWRRHGEERARGSSDIH